MREVSIELIRNPDGIYRSSVVSGTEPVPAVKLRNDIDRAFCLEEIRNKRFAERTVRTLTREYSMPGDKLVITHSYR